MFDFNKKIRMSLVVCCTALTVFPFTYLSSAEEIDDTEYVSNDTECVSDTAEIIVYNNENEYESAETSIECETEETTVEIDESPLANPENYISPASNFDDIVSRLKEINMIILNEQEDSSEEYDVFDCCRLKNDIIVKSGIIIEPSVTTAPETTEASSELVTEEPVFSETESTSEPAVTEVTETSSEETTTTTVHHPIPEVNHYAFGIDVSVYQGTINWKAVQDDDVEFAILRAGYGRLTSQIDSSFNRNYTQCKSIGMPVGAYWYSYAKTVAEAEKEADAFIYALKGKKFEYPVYLDIEDPSQQKLNRQLITDIAIAFCSRMESAGYYVGIYTNVNWTENILYSSQLKNYDKWLAHWKTNTPKYGSSFGGMWQFGSYGTAEQVESGMATMPGSINGISAACDVNLCYMDYPSLIKSKGFNGY